MLAIQILIFSYLSYFTNPIQDRYEGLRNIKSLPKQVDFITTDRLGNLYAIKKSFIWMYNKDGDSLRAFNSTQFGDVSYLDTTNPYKLLAFFKDYNVGIFLDNFLSENGPLIDFQQLGFDQATLVCLSRENGFWVFDQIRQKVLRLDENYKVTHETVSFIQWFGRQLNPNFMIQYNNRLYLNEAESGIYVFDHFGTYLKKIPLLGIKDMQVLEGVIGYLEGTNYCNYSLLDFESKCDSLPKGEIINARKEKKRFYIQYPKKIDIYEAN